MARRPEKSGRPPGLFDDPPQEVRKVPPRAGRQESDRAPEERRPAASSAEPDDPAAPYTVGQLTTAIKDRLSEFGRIRVAGEITGFKRHTSGHVYFDLKDEGARISAVIWRSTVARGLSFEPGEGDQVLAVGRELLDPVVAPVGYVNVSAGVDGHAPGQVELAIAIIGGTETR